MFYKEYLQNTLHKMIINT